MGYLQPITGMITIWTSKHGILPEMDTEFFFATFCVLDLVSIPKAIFLFSKK
jgi:hypothetical protein